ncbi:hypothetical protein DWQ65_12880 [Treponema phagedenis]|nr:hypothetical protein HMPREF9554_02948 [Treponema phagedenis F0421]QSH95661.1 hypothetical protein C5O78_11680 [Treponema phagedenis]QSI00940.1 hypothetical protein DWQ65_12880 [Treponema phagedenis]
MFLKLRENCAVFFPGKRTPDEPFLHKKPCIKNTKKTPYRQVFKCKALKLLTYRVIKKEPDTAQR